MRRHRGNLFVFLFGAALIGGCGSTGSSPTSVGSDEIVSLPVFNVWTCSDLECLNLETLESTNHTFTACASILEDAQQVGVGICEGRKASSVVSKPATCVPMGTGCAAQRAAYRLAELPEKPDKPAEKPAPGTLASADAGPDAP